MTDLSKILEFSEEQLQALNSQEREIATKILKEFAAEGKSQTLMDLYYTDYEEIPVSIEEFLHNRKYLGNALYDPDGHFTLFPYWEEKLKEIFPTPTTTNYNTIVFTGAIGLGKSTIAVICLLYMLYRLLCLKDPYLYYGMQPIDKLSISLMNITLENAKGVALDKMNQMILSSSWFMSHGTMSGTTNLVFKPEKHIELITASSNNQVIGRCLDGNTRVVTTDGIVKLSAIVDTEVQVISIDDVGNKIISEPCTAKLTAIETEEYEIELEDGSIIKCTPNHKFMLVDGTYKEAQYLTETDELFDTNITYEEFIQGIINTRGQWNIPDNEYFEVHHIVPKCLGGEGEIRKGRKRQTHPNLIFLYAREHFIAHKLLAQENPDNFSLVLAWSMMAFPKGKTQRNFEITPEEYESLRKLQSEVLKNNNPFIKTGGPWNKGRTGVYSEETLTKLRAPRPHTRGLKKSEETRKKMSEAVKKRALEKPETFGNATRNKIAVTNGSVNKYIKKDEPIPEGFTKGQKKRTHYNIKDYEAYTQQKRELTTGENNPMYGNGEKVSGGKNGHAIYIYTYKGIDYDCRDALMHVLKEEFPTISESTIRRIMANNYTARISKKYQPVIDELTWRLKKDEN